MTTTGMSLLGVNLSGAEFGGTSGTYGYNYTYPTHAEIDYYASKNLNVIRLPFRWERLQPTLGGALNSAELGRIKDIVAYAASKGMSVILDPHDFGAYNGKLVGSADVPNSAFADFWGKLSATFKTSSNVIFGLMNEPNVQTAATWLQSANAAIAAIRKAGATQEILVPGTHWTGGSTWTTSDNAAVMGPGIVDPLHNYAIEIHEYLDAYASGTQSTVVSTSIGVDRLTAVTSWAEKNGVKLFLGEFGVGQDTTSLAAMKNMLSYMSAHADAWQGATYWGAGPWWGNYMYSIEPAKGVDKPQMGVLEEFAPAAAAATSAVVTIAARSTVATTSSLAATVQQAVTVASDTGQSKTSGPVITSGGGGMVAAYDVSAGTSRITTIKAEDAETGNTVTYALLDAGGKAASQTAGFAIDASTGALSFTTVAAPGLHSVTAVVTDAKGAKTLQTLKVNVGGPAKGSETALSDIAGVGQIFVANTLESLVIGGFRASDTVVGQASVSHSVLALGHTLFDGAQSGEQGTAAVALIAAHSVQYGANTLITTDRDTSLTLQNVNRTTLLAHATDFAFT